MWMPACIGTVSSPRHRVYMIGWRGVRRFSRGLAGIASHFLFFYHRSPQIAAVRTILSRMCQVEETRLDGARPDRPKM
jgi:hypothetical protein